MSDEFVYRNEDKLSQYKRSKIVFSVTSIAPTLAPLGSEVLQLPVQSLIGRPGTLSAVCNWV